MQYLIRSKPCQKVFDSVVNMASAVGEYYQLV